MTETSSAGYTSRYYASLEQRTRKSAEVIVPIVMDLVHPRHVIDVGCGIGVWLSVFQDHGVRDVQGIDGPWVDRALLKIPGDRFSTRDLAEPLHVERTFDLAMSLEVAEHLPGRSAGRFVRALTTAAPVVLFSAAIPFQGGADHVNEQWPEYWADLFETEGFAVIDCIRKRIWKNEDVAWWYAQNILMFAGERYLTEHPDLERERRLTNRTQLSIVHPTKFEKTVRETGERLVEWLEMNQDDIARVAPSDATVILADDGMLGPAAAGDRRVISLPVPDKRTKDAGESLIREVGRLRQSGGGVLVFAWPAFWWLTAYPDFTAYLRRSYRCALSNERLVVFDLQQPAV